MANLHCTQAHHFGQMQYLALYITSLLERGSENVEVHYIIQFGMNPHRGARTEDDTLTTWEQQIT
jgi:hypothetical protein